jgi:hypothetical protein
MGIIQSGTSISRVNFEAELVIHVRGILAETFPPLFLQLVAASIAIMTFFQTLKTLSLVILLLNFKVCHLHLSKLRANLPV